MKIAGAFPEFWVRLPNGSRGERVPAEAWRPLKRPQRRLSIASAPIPAFEAFKAVLGLNAGGASTVAYGPARAGVAIKRTISVGELSLWDTQREPANLLARDVFRLFGS